jgi:hypothetical protein
VKVGVQKLLLEANALAAVLQAPTIVANSVGNGAFLYHVCLLTMALINSWKEHLLMHTGFKWATV